MEKKHVHLLIVEDNMGDAQLVKKALEEIDNVVFIIHHLSHGREIIQYLSNNISKEEIPDLILLDLNLPGKNGITILEEIKNDDNFKHIPVIIYTSSDSKKDILDSYRSYASGYITKDFDYKQIVEKLSGMSHFWTKVVHLPDNND